MLQRIWNDRVSLPLEEVVSQNSNALKLHPGTQIEAMGLPTFFGIGSRIELVISYAELPFAAFWSILQWRDHHIPPAASAPGKVCMA